MYTIYTKLFSLWRLFVLTSRSRYLGIRAICCADYVDDDNDAEDEVDDNNKMIMIMPIMIMIMPIMIMIMPMMMTDWTRSRSRYSGVRAISCAHYLQVLITTTT